MASPDIEYQLAHPGDDESSRIVISNAVVLPLAAIAVILRFISRRMCTAGLRADDWVILLSLFLAAGEVGGGLLCVANGGAKHAVFLPDPAKFAKLVMATEIFYCPAIATCKISVLLLYRRIFPGHRFHILLWIIGSIITAYSFAVVLSIIFQCHPVSSLWDPHGDFTCIKFNVEFCVMASLNVVTDIITLALPMPLLWRLQIDRERKLELMGIFLLGGFVCVVSIYRVPKAWEVSLEDPSWSDVDACVWSAVEVCIGIVCACLPTLRPLVDRSVRRKEAISTSNQSMDMLSYYSRPTYRALEEDRQGKYLGHGDRHIKIISEIRVVEEPQEVHCNGSERVSHCSHTEARLEDWS